MKIKEASMRRQKGSYFERVEGDPAPVRVTVKRGVLFNEVDAMGVVWHGNYARFFEEASSELARRCGLSFQVYYEAKIQAPIVQLHVDYHKPLMLDDLFTVEAAFVWSEGARLHTEFVITKEGGTVTATGYTVQMFMGALTKQPLLVSPEILENMRKRWQSGEFK